jgi:hypothetical protein
MPKMCREKSDLTIPHKNQIKNRAEHYANGIVRAFYSLTVTESESLLERSNLLFLKIAGEYAKELLSIRDLVGHEDEL